jgi:tripartite-type tricarboxylate transporter receptor subunit TctC
MKHTITFKRLLRLAAVVLGLASAGACFGQSLTIVVPYAAGGSLDVIARSMDAQLTASGTQTTVENKPGNAGLIGLQHVQQSDINNTIVFAPTAQLANELSAAKFSPIAFVASESFGLWSPSPTIQRNFGFASAANSMVGIYVTKLANASGGDAIPYGNSLAAIKDVKTASSNVLIGSALFENAKAMGLVLIAVSDQKNAEKLSVPTIAKKLGQDHAFRSVYGFFANSAMSATRKLALEKIVLSAAGAPAVLERINASRLDASTGGSTELTFELNQVNLAMTQTQNTAPAKTADDPKVFGRGARGN